MKVKVPAVKLLAVLIDRVVGDGGSRSLPGRRTSGVVNVKYTTVRVHTTLPTYTQPVSQQNTKRP